MSQVNNAPTYGKGGVANVEGVRFEYYNNLPWVANKEKECTYVVGGSL